MAKTPAGKAETGRTAKAPTKTGAPAKVAAANTSPKKAADASAAARESPKSMNKVDVVSAVAERTDLPRAKAAEAVDALFGTIEEALRGKMEVRLTGFGTFHTTHRNAVTGRNPQTGEPIQIAATTSVRFKAGKGLKESVK